VSGFYGAAAAATLLEVKAVTTAAGMERSDATPKSLSGVAAVGVVGALTLGASFLILPSPPSISVPLDQLVDWANGHHELLLLTAWLEAAGAALFVAFLLMLASMNDGGRRTARLLTVLFGGAVLTVSLVYAISVIMLAESSKLGGTQLRTAAVAYGLFAACEHTFLLAPPVFLALGFALRGSALLGERFSTSAVALGCAAVVVGVIGLFYAGPQNAGAAGLAINVLIGLQSLWVLVAAVSVQRRAFLMRP
jgi:hypothetical protein